MAGFVKGDVVVVPFPFSDLTQAKRRPALVIATLQGDDLILCQITSQTVSDRYAITIDNSDFSSGSLNQTSNIRPNRLFTADRQIILYKVGQLKLEKLEEAIAKITEIIQQWQKRLLMWWMRSPEKSKLWDGWEWKKLLWLNSSIHNGTSYIVNESYSGGRRWRWHQWKLAEKVMKHW
mgnify:CR=1 FL=1